MRAARLQRRAGARAWNSIGCVRGNACGRGGRRGPQARSPPKRQTRDNEAGAIEFSSDSGPFAAKAGHRDVERSAEMVLGADPGDIGSVAAKVFDAVHAVDGIVLSSSVSGGPAGDAGGSFDLLIPSAKLGDALAAFSGIAEVRSRHEATEDITAATVGAGESLQDSQAKIDGLLGPARRSGQRQ